MIIDSSWPDRPLDAGAVATSPPHPQPAFLLQMIISFRFVFVFIYVYPCVFFFKPAFFPLPPFLETKQEKKNRMKYVHTYVNNKAKHNWERERWPFIWTHHRSCRVDTTGKICLSTANLFTIFGLVLSRGFYGGKFKLGKRTRREKEEWSRGTHRQICKDK